MEAKEWTVLLLFLGLYKMLSTSLSQLFQHAREAFGEASSGGSAVQF